MLKLGGMGENEWGKLKFCMHPRAKPKDVLWLADLKDSLKNSAEITLHLCIYFEISLLTIDFNFIHYQLSNTK